MTSELRRPAKCKHKNSTIPFQQQHKQTKGDPPTQKTQLRAQEVVTKSLHPASDVAQLTIKDNARHLDKHVSNAKERIHATHAKMCFPKTEMQTLRNYTMYNTDSHEDSNQVDSFRGKIDGLNKPPANELFVNCEDRYPFQQ